VVDPLKKKFTPLVAGTAVYSDSLFRMGDAIVDIESNFGVKDNNKV